MQIKLLDILYDDQVCSLVYMWDLTKFYRNQQHDKTQQKLMLASSWMLENMKGPQQSLSILTEQMLAGCRDDQREALQAI